MKQLPKYTIGIGDRFGHQGKAQLTAFTQIAAEGVSVSPVWNKSNREHLTVGSQPASVRVEADAAVKALNWQEPYFVDADHIGLQTVDRFLQSSDFFTIDVADFIGRDAGEEPRRAFEASCSRWARKLQIPGIPNSLDISAQRVAGVARQYLAAAAEAGKIYRHIESAKGRGSFVAEVSMDETDRPQAPVDLLLILAALAREGVPIQTIAPKFTGRFNKGVDYVGDLAQFEREFNDDIAVLAFAVREFGLPANLKLSVHSGSDKFSIYPIIRQAIRQSGAGLHLKTAGTTWLEELIGLASAGQSGVEIATEIYCAALEHFDELCAPYASVIDIDRSRLPSPKEVQAWSGWQYASALRHDPRNPVFNPHFRQLLHVAYKIAAKMGRRYTDALDQYSTMIAPNVTENLLDRHLRPIFTGKGN